MGGTAIIRPLYCRQAVRGIFFLCDSLTNTNHTYMNFYLPGNGYQAGNFFSLSDGVTAGMYREIIPQAEDESGTGKFMEG